MPLRWNRLNVVYTAHGKLCVCACAWAGECACVPGVTSSWNWTTASLPPRVNYHNLLMRCYCVVAINYPPTQRLLLLAGGYFVVIRRSDDGNAHCRKTPIGRHGTGCSVRRGHAGDWKLLQTRVRNGAGRHWVSRDHVVMSTLTICVVDDVIGKVACPGAGALERRRLVIL